MPTASAIARQLHKRQLWLKRAFWLLVVLVFAGLFMARPTVH